MTSTLVALATPAGVAGVGVIRLSGPKSLDIACKLFSGFFKRVEPRYMAYGKFVHPVSRETIDDGCAVFFQGPASFTGEDVVELHCHSSDYIIKTLIAECCVLGAEIADRGAFTKRAFINGKCDLTQAESVIDLIHSQTALQHKASLNRVEGKLYRHIQGIRQQFIHFLEHIEGSIDFPDEVPAVERQALQAYCEKSEQALAHILSLHDLGALVSSGVHVVFVGRPNVGKSSLFNAFLAEDRAIVTAIAGTTRDYIHETLTFQDHVFHLYDTAGMRESADVIEFMGMEKMKTLLAKAHCIVWCVDGSEPFSEDDSAVFETIRDYQRVVMIKTKSDLPNQCTIPENVSSQIPQCLTSSVNNEVSVLGIKQFISEKVIPKVSEGDLDLLCNVRQYSVIRSLHGVLKGLKEQSRGVDVDDMLSVGIRQAVELCSELTGEAITEEVLDGVFSRFCVGK